jgi:DNA-binding HxlR family transcriptional regulator
MPNRSQEGTFMILKHAEVTAHESARRTKDDSVDHELPEECRAVRSVLALVGNKWSMMIIVILGNSPLRFNEIKRAVGGISQRMLTITLRGLERDGLVTRTPFATIPPRVDYELTALGHSLWQIGEPLDAWARAHMNAMKSARETYDKRDGIGMDVDKS